METKLIAEIGINHNGDLGIAKRLIAYAKDCGFHYVKFQKRNVHLTTPKSRWDEIKKTPWGELTYLEYKDHLELKESEYDIIDDYCGEIGIEWYASPWDIDSVDFLNKYDMPFIKVASACNTDLELLEKIKNANQFVIMSTGMTTEEQFKTAYEILGDQVICIMACTSSYPTADRDMNLEFINTLRNQYPHCNIGFSNHSPGVFFAACSVMYGASMIEVHVTLDRAMYGSDQAASIEPAGMRRLAKHVLSLEEGLGDGNWNIYDSELPVIQNLRWKDFLK